METIVDNSLDGVKGIKYIIPFFCACVTATPDYVY